MMGNRSGTITAIGLHDGIHPVELAMMFFSLQGIDHLFYQIIDIQQFQFHIRIVYLNGQVVGNVMTEGSYRRVIIGAAPFPVQIREAIHQYLGSCLLAISEEQFFPSLLALSIFRSTETACQGSLDG